MKEVLLALVLMVGSLGAMDREDDTFKPTSCNGWCLCVDARNAEQDEDMELVEQMEALGISGHDCYAHLCDCGYQANNDTTHFFLDYRARLECVKNVIGRYVLTNKDVLLLQLELAELAPFFVDECGARRCFGIDNRKKVVSHMNKRYLRDNIAFTDGKINEIGCSNTFDLILLPFCVQQIATEQLLERLIAALKPDGKLVFLVAKHTPDRAINKLIDLAMKEDFFKVLKVLPCQVFYMEHNGTPVHPFDFYVIEFTKEYKSIKKLARELNFLLISGQLTKIVQNMNMKI